MKFITYTLVALISFFVPYVSFAHVLVIDKNIGVVMHTDPDDDAHALAPSVLYFEITDKDNLFSLEKCNCSVYDGEQHKALTAIATSSQTILPDNTLKVDYVFQTPGAHTIRLVGTPKVRNAFKSFTVDYSVDVGNSEATTTTSRVGGFLSYHLTHIIIFGIGFIVVAFIIFRDEKKSMPS